jgi:hypothetical protein
LVVSTGPSNDTYQWLRAALRARCRTWCGCSTPTRRSAG